MYTEIIHIKENFLVKQGLYTHNRVNLIVVNITPQGKFLCIQQVADPDKRYEVLTEHTELCDTYKQVMAFVENAMYYTNGNEYKQ